MNHIQTPVTAVQNEIVHECWYVQDVNGQTVLLGAEREIKEIADLLNQAAVHRTDEEPGEYNTESTKWGWNDDIDVANELRELGDEDPAFALSDDGAEFLAAIGALECEEQPSVRTSYLGWVLMKNEGDFFFRAWRYNFYLGCSTARDLVTAIHVLETNGVTNEVGQ